MGNTEGEDIVKVASRVDCVFEIMKCFHGVCHEKKSCMHISIRRNCGTCYKYIRCCL